MCSLYERFIGEGWGKRRRTGGDGKQDVKLDCCNSVIVDRMGVDGSTVDGRLAAPYLTGCPVSGGVGWRHRCGILSYLINVSSCDRHLTVGAVCWCESCYCTVSACVCLGQTVVASAEM